ncbi:hypothetical protein E1218_22190 [Kribbella turkmenica]|uniref:Uncharacterized protein n=1 Tax=Kribbella turkmenica TaxID=2530375 RepID=A0A4R4WSX4_9ACTN|nr:hypothetical protein [Kribbella turkmenica]TDD20684.1 hypothetical protein E1218_22190 [Kribbella turkmenica]
MTEHPGEQFPPDVDPDVEPGFDPYPSEDDPETPDYDAEPSPQNFSYGEAGPPDGDTDAAFEASLEEPGGHVDPAAVEFGPEFARAPGEEHEHSFAAESAVPEHAEPASAGEAGPEPAGEAVAEYSAEDGAPDAAADGDERAHPLVEETMGRLGELRDRPVGEHADVYADLHERLQSALVEADAEPGDRNQTV